MPTEYVYGGYDIKCRGIRQRELHKIELGGALLFRNYIPLETKRNKLS